MDKEYSEETNIEVFAEDNLWKVFSLMSLWLFINTNAFIHKISVENIINEFDGKYYATIFYNKCY